MPTYHCVSSSGTLDPVRKAFLAAEITRVHARVTGAGGHFAQVFFTETGPDDFYVGGRALDHNHLYVNGSVRAGRPAEMMTRLVAELLEAVSDASGLERRNVWVYVGEIPHSQIAEWGHIVPAPGEEESWFAGLPEADRDAIANAR